MSFMSEVEDGVELYAKIGGAVTVVTFIALMLFQPGQVLGFAIANLVDEILFAAFVGLAMAVLSAVVGAVAPWFR